MPERPACVTLTTDFGQTDHYVGQMKGAILRVAPHASIVDITHAVPPQNIRAASFLLADLREDVFPEGTVHLAVVDPGVGSDRRVIALEAGRQFFLAPDNGLLTLILDRFPKARPVEITAAAGEMISATFHGRDLMAPAAARLAREGRIADLGRPLASEPLRLEGLYPRRNSETPRRIEGIAAWIDHFGNVITNIPEDMLADASAETVTVQCGGGVLRGLRRYYSEVPAGEPILLAGSSGRLEIATNSGSAAERWAVRVGDLVVVEWEA